MYEVEVEDFIEHRRDNVLEDLRERLTVELGLHHGDEPPTEAALSKLGKRVRIERRGDKQIKVTFTKQGDAGKLSRRFLERWADLEEVNRDGGAVLLQLADAELQAMRESAVQQAVEVVGNRIDELGLRETSVTSREEDIVVEVPGASERDFQRIKDIIGRTARLEFLICDDANRLLETIATDLPSGITLEHETMSTGPGQSAQSPYLKATGRRARERLRDYIGQLDREGKIPEEFLILTGEEVETDDEGKPRAERYWKTYLVYRRAEVTGDDLADASVQIDQQENTPYVALEFTPRGAESFERITSRNVQKRFAIVLDDRVDSAPVIKQRIAGGRAQITLGGYKSYNELLKEAGDLVVVLRAGALPAPITPVNEQRVGPSIGAHGVRQGVLAFGVGTAAVFLFLCLYYKTGGVVSVLGIVLNTVIVFAGLSTLGATLTLPGIAGLILTVGMSDDCNVIISERIREELRAGKSPRSAVDAGYTRAFWAIFDSNVTTLIAAIVLMQYGTGAIKGFAVTLTIGIISNLFTGVFCTRVLFDWIVRSRTKETLAI
jgi:preprotein translocase subunit SecD